MDTARLVPEAMASSGRGRQLRWNVAMAAWNAPNAELAAAAGPKSHRLSAITIASPAAPRTAMSGSSRFFSTAMPERAVSFSARRQLTAPAYAAR
ncbi:hypothetical protein GCM10010306_073420 [Streptomyces umbrinus]|nr:hypothetical protein GCM10010306_073420 [Streptomyces umbrinus]